MTEIQTLADEASGLYAALEQTGSRAMGVLRSSDPELVDELLATFESGTQSVHWLVSRTIGFGDSSALELLAQGERQSVIQLLKNLRDGIFA
ncbi:hypothetical protein BZM27_46675 [Paraburkholderia steynii]|uniref:Antitoxin Xre/MbcA/ParS-like toxin-binding domain-containing protein n=1 Tax=Paraburkholderia steynii TaxID=1245441 RepID=A0A4R0X9V3_9BURK|nr:hypothetical protein BZM27_46675 [Paraburkholderia steynii]